MTQVSRTHSHSIISVPYSMDHSIHMPGECMGRELSRICTTIRLFKNGRISFPVISPTCIQLEYMISIGHLTQGSIDYIYSEFF